jgi:hypothetical protein
MTKERRKGLLVRAEPLEQAERISNSIAEVRVVDGALLVAADPGWAGAINMVLAKKGVRVSEVCVTAKDEPEATSRSGRAPSGHRSARRATERSVRKWQPDGRSEIKIGWRR